MILSNETVGLGFLPLSRSLGQHSRGEKSGRFHFHDLDDTQKGTGWGRQSHESGVPVAAEILLILAMCSIISKNGAGQKSGPKVA